jgi:hypothetical protein
MSNRVNYDTVAMESEINSKWLVFSLSFAPKELWNSTLKSTVSKLKIPRYNEHCGPSPVLSSEEKFTLVPLLNPPPPHTHTDTHNTHIDHITELHVAWKYFKISCFQTRLHSRERRLLASPCPSVCPHASARLPLDRFPWNLILGTCMKICPENPSLVKIGQTYRVFYMMN